MKKINYSLIIILFFLVQSLFSQPKEDSWKNWQSLLGKWVGIGSGAPGENQGYFTFEKALNGNILVRKNHTEFPASGDKPASVHDDLMIVYLDNSGIPSNAIYFDNEGHTINYKIVYAENTITLTSEAIKNVPSFRLIYLIDKPDEITVLFEIALPQNPNQFNKYLEGRCKKVSE